MTISAAPAPTQNAELAGECARVGPIRLAPGIERRHALTYIYLSFFSVASTVFLSFVQPYVFNEILQVPADQQGTLAGRLVLFNELVVLTLIGVAGTVSDKIGRRPVYVFGFALLATGYILYPLAGSPTELIVYRMVFALGIVGATSMLATVGADYPQDRDRGKLIGTTGFLQALGVILVVFLLANLPQKLAERDFSPRQAGEITLWLFAGICVFNAIVARLGLKGGVPSQLTTRERFWMTLRRGLKAAENPRIALAYVAAMVSRGDLSVVSTFFSLWLVQVGVAQGMTSAEALKAAVRFFGIVQVFAFLWAPVIGVICDRINRVSALCVAMALAATGYLTASLLPDPMGPAMYAAAIILGMGEVSAVIAAQALIGQEAPQDGRGSVIGVFGVSGAIGILGAGWLGGQLFDAWRPSAPFILMGGANLTLLVLALLVRWKRPA